MSDFDTVVSSQLLSKEHLSSSDPNDAMVEILTQAAAQVPALVVLCLLVYIFVGSLKAERTAIEKIAEDSLDRNTEAMANNQHVLSAVVQALNRNTEMLGRTLGVVERMERHLGARKQSAQDD